MLDCVACSSVAPHVAMPCSEIVSMNLLCELAAGVRNDSPVDDTESALNAHIDDRLLTRFCLQLHLQHL